APISERISTSLTRHPKAYLPIERGARPWHYYHTTHSPFALLHLPAGYARHGSGVLVTAQRSTSGRSLREWIAPCASRQMEAQDPCTARLVAVVVRKSRRGTRRSPAISRARVSGPSARRGPGVT